MIRARMVTTFAAAATTFLVVSATPGHAGAKSSSPSIPSITPTAGTPPRNTVRIDDNSNAQALVDTNPVDSAFVLAAGVHTQFSVVPKSGDRFYGAPGAVLDGSGGIQSAFSETRARAAQDVVIVGASATHPLVVQNYGSTTSPQFGAIQALPARHSSSTLGSGWRLQWLDVTQNAARGISISSGMTIYQCRVTGNGRLGIGGGGTGIEIEDDIVSTNGVNVLRTGFEAGGIKTVADDVVIAHDRISDNGAPGVWTDSAATGITIADNTIVGNGVGVQVEISRNVTVWGNLISRSRQQAILVVASDTVGVVNNRVTANFGGIIVGGVHRIGPGGVHLDHVVVRSNTVSNSGVSGLHQAVPGSVAISFDRDHYVAERFVWEGHRLTLEQWQTFGQERRGTSSS
jgi:hypothetical protein